MQYNALRYYMNIVYDIMIQDNAILFKIVQFICKSLNTYTLNTNINLHYEVLIRKLDRFKEASRLRQITSSLR